MSLEVLRTCWPILLGLAFLLVTCVLFILAAEHRKALEAHDRILASNALRRRYLESVRQRQSRQ